MRVRARAYLSRYHAAVRHPEFMKTGLVLLMRYLPGIQVRTAGQSEPTGQWQRQHALEYNQNVVRRARSSSRMNGWDSVGNDDTYAPGRGSRWGSWIRCDRR